MSISRIHGAWPMLLGHALRFFRGPCRSGRHSGATATCAFAAVLLCCAPGQLRGQASNDPSDATPSLSYSTNAGVVTPIPTAANCGVSGSVNPSSGQFSLAGSTSTPVTIVAPAICGNFREPPPAISPGPANDVWFRLDPPVAETYFRFTLYPGSAPAMAGGALALYEAPTAAGPFRLIECSSGGGISSGLASVENRSSTPGHKLYLRVWDRNNRNSNVNFTLCVHGQTAANIPPRGAGETACSATPLAASGSLISANTTTVDYAFAQEEDSWLFTDSSYVGGDLWLSLEVPPSGVVRMAIGRGSAAAGALNSIGVSAYLSPDCADHSQYRQVGAFNNLPNAFPSAGASNWQINCLPPGATLYLRIHSTRAAQQNTRRYGRLRIVWSAGGAIGTPPPNNHPCGATALAFNTPCPISPSGRNNFDACNTPGIPDPTCGGFDGNSFDVWYSFVAPASGTVQIEASPSTPAPADPAIALYSTGGNGCAGRFTLIQCDDKMGPGNSARIVRTGLTPGQTYYVRAWAEGINAVGSFDICLSEPAPAGGGCFYLLELWAMNNVGVQNVDMIIGTDTTTFSTTIGDPSELFLIEVPTGASVFFRYYQVDGSRLQGAYSYVLTRSGDPTVLWTQAGGEPVFGPGEPWNPTFTLNNACAPIVPTITDCLGARTICNAAGTVFGELNSTMPPGNALELTATNMGCLSTEASGIAWFLFRPTMDGTVAFWFTGTHAPSTTDLDFAIWDAGSVPYVPEAPHISAGICAPQGPPVRCSSARTYYSTGMQTGLHGAYQEGAGGLGWLSPLPVQMDHVYLIAVVRATSTTPVASFEMRWTQFTNSLGTPTPALLECTALVLPVEYLHFNGHQQEQLVVLDWATATEKNSSHFLVQRSSNGIDFHTIGLVGAAGNSSSRIDYRYTDGAPQRGVNYYRLEQVDLDGTSSYSGSIVVVFHEGEQDLQLYPNPTADRLTIGTVAKRSGTVMFLITDALGRAVHTEFADTESGPLRADLTVGMLAPGTYLVQAVGADGVPLGSARFIKL